MSLDVPRRPAATLLAASLAAAVAVYLWARAPELLAGIQESRSLAQHPPVAFHADVARILQNRCQVCHRAGGMAPFSLESYSQAYSLREAIYDAVAERRMPPWFADPSVGVWANDRRLTEEDRRTLLAWILQGAPEGNPAEGPPPAAWPEGWTIGQPDAVISIPEPIRVPATGVMAYRYVYAETDFDEDRWIQAFQVRPSAPEVVHHVLVFIEEPDYPGQVHHRSLVRPGFQIGREGYFAAHVPGYAGITYPNGTAKLLPKGASLKFQLHYTPHGMEMEDQTEIGLIFADAPPDFRVETGAAMSMTFVVPPGARDHAVAAEFRFSEPARLLALSPHMHLRGSRFRYELLLPDGRRERLLELPRWDFRWQDDFIFREPPEVPRGSVLRATGWFDNSRRNPLNPDPTATVRFGEQTFEEMMNGYFQYLVPNPSAALRPGDE